MKGYLIKYRYRGANPSPSYQYQRFFRALYGYTQIVTKAGGKSYVYYREGVLTLYPYLREGRNVVLVPENALEPLINFFKTGENPAHKFERLDNWVVSYYIEEVSVEAGDALRALHDALRRILIRTPIGLVRVWDALLRRPDPDTLLGIREKTVYVVESPWFRELYEEDETLYKLYDLFNRAQQILE